MKRFNDNENENNGGVKRFIPNYIDNLNQQQQQQQQLTSKELLYGSSLNHQYYNGAQQQQQSQLNKNQQEFKYTPLTMYPPPSIEQGPTYYNSYYNNNTNWRYTSPPTSFTYDPSQPPPPIPKLNIKSDSPKPPPLPPLPPGDPPYYASSPSLAMKNALSINSTQQTNDNQQQQQQQQQQHQPPSSYSPMDPNHGPPPPHPLHPNIPNNVPRRPPPSLLNRGNPVFRGAGVMGPGGMVRGERPPMKRPGAYPFNKKLKPPFNKQSNALNNAGGSGGSSMGGGIMNGPVQLNGQKKSTNKSQSNSRNNANDADDDADDNLSHIQVNKKAKRKPMSTRYPRKIEWDRGDALKALALEKEYNKLQRNSMLILKFPDPELNKNIVKEYSPYIESVHFQQPSTPRYCFVQLKDGVDIEKVREELCKIPFGIGRIVAERKRMHSEEDDTVNPEDIDPYTLYIGNLPTTITVKTVKEHFPNSRRIDIGYAQRMRYTRYAFIRYETVEDAMEAYRNTFNLLIESRSLIVRFRRQKGNVGLPGESRPSNPKKEPNIINQQQQPLIQPQPQQIQQDQQQQQQQQNRKLQTGLTTIITKTIDMINQTIDINNDSTSNGNQDNDDDVCYVSGETSKFDQIDSKAHVLEQSRELSKQRESMATADDDSITTEQNTSTVNNTVIKQEPIDDGYEQDDDIVQPSRPIKDEPYDDDELLRRADCYEAFDYSDNDQEEGDDPDHLNDDDKYEEKPDIKSLPVPFPIYNDNNETDDDDDDEEEEPDDDLDLENHETFQQSISPLDPTNNSTMTSTENTNINNSPENNNTNDSTKKSNNGRSSYRDELDDLFDRMNAEDDDFTF